MERIAVKLTDYFTNSYLVGIRVVGFSRRKKENDVMHTNIEPAGRLACMYLHVHSLYSASAVQHHSMYMYNTKLMYMRDARDREARRTT